MPSCSATVERIQSLGCELRADGGDVDVYTAGDRVSEPNHLKPLLEVIRGHKAEFVRWLQQRSVLETSLRRAIAAARDHRDLRKVCEVVDRACQDGALDRVTAGELTAGVCRRAGGLSNRSNELPPIWAETLLGT